MHEKFDAIIIGGGITGLAAAYRFHEFNLKASCKVRFCLLESSPNVGGIIRTTHRDGFLMEHGPDAFLCENPALLRLVERLGLESEVIPTQDSDRGSFLVHRDRLYPIPKGFFLISPSKLLPLLQCSFLSMRGRIRMAFEYFLAPRKNDAEESVAQFIRRRFGEEALLRIGEPMVGGIYAGDASKLSAKSVLSRFCKMEIDDGSVVIGIQKHFKKSVTSLEAHGPRYGLFVSLRSGMQKLVESLSQVHANKEVKSNYNVKKIEFIKNERTWKISSDHGTIEAPHVMLTIPACKAHNLLKPMAPALSEHLKKIPYESIAVTHLAYERKQIRHRLNGFGFVAPPHKGLSMLGCTFSSVKFAGRAPKGRVLLRVFSGGAFGKRFLEMPDKELKTHIQKDLSRLLGIKGNPLFCEIKRLHHALPQYHVGHEGILQDLETELSLLKGLYLLGNGYRGIGMPDCVDQAHQAADRILETLQGPKSLAIKEP
jgi:protoporphyrinogen/coproporphyrinogen III oxidase